MPHVVKITPDDPPDGSIVETLICDADGVRNQQELKRVGRLWYIPDGSMYVYYTPTHYLKGEAS